MARILALFLFLIACRSQAELVITMGGDVNFNESAQAPLADHVIAHGKDYKWPDLTTGIKDLINGDINFANIETVVTDDVNLAPQEKEFVFRSHPNSIRNMLDLGLNMLSLANNHAFDYGRDGIEETLKNIGFLQTQYPALQHAGLGRNLNEVAKPAVFKVRGYRIAFAAIGITSAESRATQTEAGMLVKANPADFAFQIEQLRNTDADYKILSIHGGVERVVDLETNQQKLYEDALKKGGIDLIIGHHPHVVRPIERIDDKVIIYSLGNFIMSGAENMNKYSADMDYGLFTRLYLDFDFATQRLKLQALEAVPLTEMHLKSHPMDQTPAADRIKILNALSEKNLGEAAMKLEVRPDGSGVACGSGTLTSARALALCKPN